MVPSRHIHIHAVPKRLAAFLGSANGREDSSSLSGWNSGGVEHLHGVFPGSFAWEWFVPENHLCSRGAVVLTAKNGRPALKSRTDKSHGIGLDSVGVGNKDRVNGSI